MFAEARGSILPAFRYSILATLGPALQGKDEVSTSTALSLGANVRHAPRIMGMQTYAWRIEAAQQGVRLDDFLAGALSKSLRREFTREQARKLIERGAVGLGGRQARSATSVLPLGAQVEVCGDAKWLGSAAPKNFEWNSGRIIFEDRWLIAVDKPAGLPTQATLDASRANVCGLLNDFLQKRDGGATYLGLHHRLDRDTSGVLLFTKDPSVNAGVAELFASRSLGKTYQALTVKGNSCADAWEVKNYLGVVARKGKASKFGPVRSGGDPAHTSFKVVERFSSALLIEARPHTGRTHQIRVHLAGNGHPILGDLFYGGPAKWKQGGAIGVPIPRVMLHAAALDFVHPATHCELTIRSPLPEDFVSCLAQIRSGGNPSR